MMTLGGCGFWAAPPDGDIACTTPSDCPADRPYCPSSLRRCVVEGIANTPALTFALADGAVLEGAATTLFTAEITPSRALAAAPVIVVVVADVSHAFLLSDQIGERYLYTFTLGDQPVPSGTYPVLARGTDALGASYEIELASLHYDRDAPTLTAIEVARNVASPNIDATYFFALSEGAPDLPVVQALSVGGEVVPLVVTQTETAQRYEARAGFESATAQAVGDEPMNVTVRFSDAVGNETSAALATLVLDGDAPEVASVVLGAERVKAGDTVTLSVEFTEPVSDGLVLQLLSPLGDIVESVAADLNGRFASFSLLIEGTYSGNYGFQLDDVRDLAANEAPVIGLAATVTIDSTAPSVLNFAPEEVVLVPNQTRLVTFEADEPLGEVPQVRVVTPTGKVPLAPVDAPLDGPFTFSIESNDIPEQGTFLIEVLVTDQVGLSRLVTPGEATVDTVAPTLSVTPFSPPLAPLGAVVTIVVTADEPLEEPPTLMFDTGVLDFSVSGNDTVFTYALVVDATTTEGDHVLTSVLAADRYGNMGTATLSQTLTIDTSAPTLSAQDFNRDLYSEVAGFNDVVLTFEANEPLGEIEASLDAADDFACVSTGPTAYRCTGEISATVASETPFLVGLVTARDDAGNTESYGFGLAADFAPPGIVSGTPSLAASSPPGFPGADSKTIFLNSTATVGFRASEALAVSPSLTVAPGNLLFSETGNAANEWIFSATLDTVAGPNGPQNIEVRLEDVVGHVANIELPLPEPGLVLAEVVTSLCVAEDAAQNPLPTDFDGDGFFGWGPACNDILECPDCHDADATVFPGAPEIPFDGAVNDCSGGVEPELAVLSAVYVDAAAAAGGDGSALSPFNNLVDAVAAAPVGAIVALSSGTHALGEYIEFNGVSLVGGLDASTWKPGPEPTVVEGDQPYTEIVVVADGTPAFVANVRFVNADLERADVGLAPVVMSNIDTVGGEGYLSLAERVTVVGSRLGHVGLYSDFGDVRVIQSELVFSATVYGQLPLAQVRTYFIRNRITGGRIGSGDFGHFVAMNNVFYGGGNPFHFVTDQGLSDTTFVGNTIVMTEPINRHIVFEAPATQSLWLNNAFFIASPDLDVHVVSAAACDIGDLNLRVAGNVFPTNTPSFINFDGMAPCDVYEMSMAEITGELVDCSEISSPWCPQWAMGNALAPQIAGTEEDAKPATHPALVGAGISPHELPPTYGTVSTTYAGGIDGGCRDLTAPTVGAFVP